MQCFERQAMYLKLYADAIVEAPDLEFDADLLDEILVDFEIDRFEVLMSLDDSSYGEILTSLKLLNDSLSEKGPVTRGDGEEVDESSDYTLPCSLLRPNSTLTRAVIS